MTLRIGHGYDVHRLTEGRRLILGGVEIPFEKGLLGHSDADALTHAVIDALFGALALGDIGSHFPDSDPRYLDIDSILLLKQAMVEIRAQGWKLQNLDATIVAQAPKLAPFIPAMRSRLAEAMDVPLSAISVKATTEERLGFTGSGEGISATAVLLLVRPETPSIQQL
jgi:2-C-methyl-D-erythritol 2,4-cyclodiphosphate synthase